MANKYSIASIELLHEHTEPHPDHPKKPFGTYRNTLPEEGIPCDGTLRITPEHKLCYAVVKFFIDGVERSDHIWNVPYEDWKLTKALVDFYVRHQAGLCEQILPEMSHGKVIQPYRAAIAKRFRVGVFRRLWAWVRRILKR